MYQRVFKRVLDFSLSAAALLLLSPVMAAVAVLVAVKLGRPVIFCQTRTGWREKPFQLYKFRTMTDARDEAGNLLPDEARLPPFGRMLRSTSLDELPEFWNILLGQMSLVGPRPLLPRYLPRYSEEQRRRHDVRPGLTGLAQVKGRNALSWGEKFRYDVAYARHVTFWGDVKILAATVKLVLRREGISQAGSATMEEFNGHN